MRLPTRVIFCFLFSVFCFLFSVRPTFAQTTTVPAVTPNNNSYAAPNLDSNVPRNQHTYAQAVTIEVLSAVLCQLTGIDAIDPATPCLGINPATKRLGYAPQEPGNNKVQVGGLVGTATNMITFTYRPMVTTGVYTEYLASNFGIVKKAYAQVAPNCISTNQGVGYGFCGLMPIFNLWVAVRNISYALLVFAFTFIGLGIMLRIKIDPRTVMTIQNQIPKVIIAIILITFSYAISAILVDVMWLTTYAGVNLITTSSDQAKQLDAGEGPGSFQTKSTRQLLEIPLVYVNGVFHTDKGGAGFTNSGILHVTNKVSNFIGDTIYNVARSILGIDDKDIGGCFDTKKLGPLAIPTKFNFGQCVADVFGFIAKLVANLIIFCSLIIALFKIWYNLLKAYVYSLFYIILSPVFIVLGLLPTKPLGFENWLRRFFSNIAIFPITAFVLVAARLLMDTYERVGAFDPNGIANKSFIPPLIGHNADSNFGALLAFGAILIAPQLQTILREKMGVKQIGSPGIIAAGFGAGMAAVGAPVGRAMKHLNRYDARTGDKGALAVLKRKTGEGVIGAFGKLGVKSAKRSLAQRRAIDRVGEAREGSDVYKEEYAKAGMSKKKRLRYESAQRKKVDKEEGKK